MMRKYILFTFSLLLFFPSVMHGRNKRVAVVSMAIGDKYQECVKLATQTKQQYCKKHDYDFYFLKNKLDDRHPVWSAILYMSEVMSTNKYDWLFWTDGDAMIMNDEVILETFLDDDYDMIISKDMNDLNMGHFFLKNSKWSKILLNQIYNNVDFVGNVWEEQAAFLHLYHKKSVVKRQVKIIDQRLFNSYPCERHQNNEKYCYREGDFIVHFVGLGKQLERLKDLVEKYYKKKVKFS